MPKIETPATIARWAMHGMPAGIYVVAMRDDGHGLYPAENYPARDAREARSIARTVRQSYGTVTTVTVK